jgi:hypothetical protein
MGKCGCFLEVHDVHKNLSAAYSFPLNPSWSITVKLGIYLTSMGITWSKYVYGKDKTYIRIFPPENHLQIQLFLNTTNLYHPPLILYGVYQCLENQFVYQYYLILIAPFQYTKLIQIKIFPNILCY